MWRCEHKDYSCRARIHTDAITGDVLKNLGDHNYDSNAAKIEVVRTVTAVKRKAVDTNEGTAQVMTYSMSNWSPDTLFLGSFDDIDCVTKESNGLCKAMQTTASWTICVDSPTISR